MWQVLVGATGHEPRGNLQTVFRTLAQYGVNVTSVERCGKFAFIAQKGSPEKTSSVLKRSAGGNAWLVVKVINGTCFRFHSYYWGLLLWGMGAAASQIHYSCFRIRRGKVTCNLKCPCPHFYSKYSSFLPRDALVHSAVLRLHVVRLSVCLSVRPSVRL